MLAKKNPVLYKKQPAIITDFDGDKILIKYQSVPATSTGKPAQYNEQKVRDKDIILLHNKEVSSLEKLISFEDSLIQDQIKETYELLISDEETKDKPVLFSDLADLLRSSYTSDETWFIYKNLLASLEFSLDENSLKNGIIQFIPCSQEEIELQQKKLYEKEHEAEIRNEFLARLKQKQLNLPDDAKFMVEVEAFALGKTDKSKTLEAVGISQTVEKAHKLLIETGIWDITRNPYPSRFGLSANSATEGLGTPPEEERVKIPTIAYAIDNEWSTDPDDAISWDGTYLWVHIADPASYVTPDSNIDKVARNRGTTLYIPEGASRMLAETALEDYALGLKEESNALSFRIKLTEENTIEECNIFKTKINVKRLTYKQADELKDSEELKPFFEIARKNILRRQKSGSVQIDMPEIHISVDSETKKVDIQPLIRYEADAMICEMMLLAGEGAAYFAFKNRIPFPYVSQEAPDIPNNIEDGLAGQFRLLKCMHKRSVGITPAMHSGLGLAMYSQVTSPLRRYGDLVAHEQIRCFLDGRQLLDKDEMLERISQGDAASIAAKKASRFSEIHWKLIYLLQNPEWTGNAICIEKKGTDGIFMIPSLAMQTLIKGVADIQLNQEITVRSANIDIPTQAIDFIKI